MLCYRYSIASTLTVPVVHKISHVFYIFVLVFFSSLSHATITFEGDDGVKQIIEVAGGCSGCHYGADAPTACSNPVDDDLDLVATAWYASTGTDTAKYNSANACRSTIQKRVNTSSYVNPAGTTDPYIYMPQSSTCDPFNEFTPAGTDTSGCLSPTHKNVMLGWGGTRWAIPQVTMANGTGENNKGGTFNASVLINGAVLESAYFRYSTTDTEICRGCLGQMIAVSTLPTSSGGGTTAYAIEQVIDTLSCNTLYYYKAYATNSQGTNTAAGIGIGELMTASCTAPTIVEGTEYIPPNVTEDIAAQFTLNATDPDNGALTWSISDNSSPNGEAVVDAPETGMSTTVTYTPAQDYAGADTFKVKVTDESGGFAEITVNLTVNQASDPPTITEEVVEGVPITVLMSEDGIPTAFSLSLTGEDADPDTTLNWSIDTPAGSGVASVTGTTLPGGVQTITYVPADNLNGMPADSFVVGVYDNGVQSGNSDQITVNVNITALNDPPVAVDDVFNNVLVNSSGNVLDVLANDVDVDLLNEGDSREIVSVDAVSGGGSVQPIVAGVNNTITYAPAADAVAVETITYTMKDAFGVTDTATVTVSPPDTDGDGVFDYIDNCAATDNGPLQGSDNQADNDGDQVINVNTTSDPADPLVGGDACDTDDDNDGMPDSFENTHGFDQFDAADAALDKDGDGISNLQEFLDGTDPTQDSVAPIVTAPADITVNATGLLTVVNLGTATGNDGNDGVSTILKAALNLSPEDITDLETPPKGCQMFSDYETNIKPFRPGSHTVTWATCDSSGNAGHDSQTVNVKPLVSVTSGQFVGEGQPVTIDVVLNGEAIAYPATVNYTITGTAVAVEDHDALSGTVTFNSPGDTGVISFNTITDAFVEADETVVVTLHSPNNVALSNARVHTVTITEANITPKLSLSAIQSVNAIGNIIYQPDGVVTVVANASDANGDALTYDWSASNASLLAASAVSGNQVDIDPALLSVGSFYRLAVTVTDGQVPVTVERLLQVKAAEVNVWFVGEDSDGDGADNISEGYGDVDADGIPNYIDNSFTPANVIENQTVDLVSSMYIETDPGLHIALGETAVAAQTSGVMIGLQDIIDFGGPGGTAVNNADSEHRFLSALLDFEISALTDDIESVHVVIPLLSAIQDGAVYRKYNSSGWFDFVIDDNNAIHSAAGNDGACPQPGSNLYSSGLTVGHLCLQLTIQDGGANDADGVRNYVVKDPGGLASAPEPEAVVDTSASQANGRVGSVSLWFVSLLSVTVMLIWWIRLMRVKSLPARNS